SARAIVTPSELATNASTSPMSNVVSTAVPSAPASAIDRFSAAVPTAVVTPVAVAREVAAAPSAVLSPQPIVATVVRVQSSPSAADRPTPTAQATRASGESSSTAPPDRTPMQSTSNAVPAAVADSAARVVWSVAPQPGVSYQWWVFTNGRWTLAQDW